MYVFRRSNASRRKRSVLALPSFLPSSLELDMRRFVIVLSRERIKMSWQMRRDEYECVVWHSPFPRGRMVQKGDDSSLHCSTSCSTFHSALRSKARKCVQTLHERYERRQVTLCRPRDPLSSRDKNAFRRISITSASNTQVRPKK